MTDTNTYQAQANELSQKLWAIANDLRGQMDASEFKNYILGVIFYRYLSERTEMYMIDLLKNDDGITYEEAFADEEYRPVVEEWSLSKLGYVIKPENLFRNLIRKITKFENDADKFSVEDFEKAINDLVGSTMGHESNKAFDGLFNDMRLQDSRLGETVADRTEMIGRVMVRVSDIDFDLQDSQFDVLGTAYMILIGLFASDAGKKGGEFFTPAGPSKLCATLAALGLDEAKTVGDCTCGSASMLLEVQKHLTTGKVGHFYGQELNATTYNLSRMNMIMHGIDWQNFDIYKGDTLKDDKYGDIKMTVQVCNPPYSLKWSADKQFEDDPRYSGAGKLAPKGQADLAFVEHMIYHMDEDDGRVAVLLPHGVLFRGGAEETIRKYIIKDLNRLDAVIGLPANLFHGTGIPVCVLVLKCKRNGNAGNILFIDASKEFKAGKNQNVLEQKHIDKIVEAYEKRVDVDKLYMNYYMRTNHMLRKINNQSYGVMEFRKRLYWNSFSNIRCSVPSLSEQKRVAELLNMVETVIEKQKKTITAWEERKKGVMQKIFSQKVRFKDEDGNEFPEWKKKKIDDLFYKVNERNNGQFGKNKWISVARMYYQDEDKVTSNNIDTRTYVMRIGDMAFEGHPNKEFKYGRFVVNDIGDGVISELFPIYRHKEKYILKYWKYAIQVDAIMQKIYRKAIISSGASSNKLDDSDFKKQSILVPCLAEQQRIADCLSAIDDVINNYKETLTAWKELKKGLLQQMFV